MALSFLKGLLGGTPGNDAEVPVSADNPLPVTVPGGLAVSVSTTGGVPFNGRLPSSAASNNATNLKASAAQVFYIVVYNTNAALRYLKLYNKATAPVPNTDAALVVMTIPIPPNGGVAIEVTAGINVFPNGLGYALVTGAADNDNTSVGAGDIVGLNIGYA